MRNCRIQPERVERASIGRSRLRPCSPGSPSAAPTRSATPTSRPEPASRDPQAALRRERPARAGRSSRRARPRCGPRARLHEGPPADRGQQPPDPPRRRRRRPQRDHLQRRRADGAHGFERAEPRDDRRLRGDLRARRGVTAATPSALEELRGSMATAWLDERRPGTLFLARGVGRPLWIGDGPRGELLRVDEAGARGRRAVPGPQAAQARGRRGHARRVVARTASVRAEASLQARPRLRGVAAPGRARARTRARSAFSASRAAAIAA